MASGAAVKQAEGRGHSVKRERTFGLAYVKALKRIAHLEAELDSLQRRIAEYEVRDAPRNEAATGSLVDEPDPGEIEAANARRAERAERRRRKRLKRKTQRAVVAGAGIVAIVVTVLWVMSVVFSFGGGSGWGSNRDSETINFDTGQ